jgi:hypothetical protein
MSDEPDKTPLTAAEVDLAMFTSGRAIDPLLHEQAKRAWVGFGLGISVLVNGMIVMGQLAQPDRMAEELDSEWAMVMKRSPKPDDSTDEEWAEIGKRITGATAAMTALRKERTQLSKESEPFREDGVLDTASAPADVARTAIYSEAFPHLTLVNANIFAPGQAGPTKVEVMRVAIDQIAAWWPLRTDEQGNTSFQLWRTDGEPSQSVPPR